MCNDAMCPICWPVDRRHVPYVGLCNDAMCLACWPCATTPCALHVGPVQRRHVLLQVGPVQRRHVPYMLALCKDAMCLTCWPCFNDAMCLTCWPCATTPCAFTSWPYATMRILTENRVFLNLLPIKGFLHPDRG
ncbi:hypothetical protein CEXT_279681 [Caerostris extrusa]|uniref:Uncharacterized protein n=1 Tax=Caerostris extrusa TaxID=172846 RepID=A0AAV4TGC7_CAEEX|nr:hypothetical protein CEXT_279681 [Caerostris extrusa]